MTNINKVLKKELKKELVDDNEKNDNTKYNSKDNPKDNSNIKDNNNLDIFDNFIMVHNNYKGQLKSYNKKNFDPFCRRNRIKFYYEPSKYFVTTVGQLNFFKWAIENYIINYIDDNIKTIEEDMNSYPQIEELTDDSINKLKIASGKTIKKDILSNKNTQNIEENIISINNFNITKSYSNTDNSYSNTVNSESDSNTEIKKKSNSGKWKKEELTKKRRKKTSATKKKKKETNTITKSMVRHNYPTVISFD